MKIRKTSLPLIVISTLPLYGHAAPQTIDDYLAINIYWGERIANDVSSSEQNQTVKISNNFAQALALSWYYEPNKEGELLFSHGTHRLSLSEPNRTSDVHFSYLHFGGRVHSAQTRSFSVNLGLGLGATFITPKENEFKHEIAWSGNITAGMRYQLTRQWALRGDLRVFGTVLNADNALFCSNGECLVKFSGELYAQTELMAGIEYKF